jgi:hypothetical protein
MRLRLPLGAGNTSASLTERLVPMTARGAKFWDSKAAIEELSILEQRLPRMRRSLKKMQTSGLQGV